jgi:hypothetical protein
MGRRLDTIALGAVRSNRRLWYRWDPDVAGAEFIADKGGGPRVRRRKG